MNDRVSTSKKLDDFNAIDRIEADVIELKINQAVIKTKLEA